MCRHEEIEQFFLVTVLNLVQRPFSVTYITVINVIESWKQKFWSMENLAILKHPSTLKG